MPRRFPATPIAAVIALLFVFCAARALAVAVAPTWLLSWGSQGTGPGQFQFPHGMAIGADGTIYVADTANHRVQKFLGSGQALGGWGTPGAGDGQFNTVDGICVSSADCLCVRRREQPHPAFHDERRVPRQGILRHGQRGVRPARRRRDRCLGNVYGRPVRRPHSEIHGDRSVARDHRDRRSGSRQVNRPSAPGATARAPHVTEWGNARVQVFAPDGFRSDLGSAVRATDSLTPASSRSMRTGRSNVVDVGNNRVQVFTSEGTSCELGHASAADRSFGRSTSSWDAEGMVYVETRTTTASRKFDVTATPAVNVVGPPERRPPLILSAAALRPSLQAIQRAPRA